MKTKKKLALLVLGLVLNFMSLNAPCVFGDETDVVKVNVTVALAVPGGEQIDPRLGSIREDLKNTFAQASYEQLDEMRFDLDLQEEDSRSLPGNSQIAVQYLGATDGKVTLNVKISEQGTQVLNTNFSISKGGTIIVGGPPYKGGNLVLAIKATN